MLDNDTMSPPHAIAIVGLAGRFPGADDIDSFWRNLRNGVESIRPLSESELRQAGVPAEEMQHPDYVRVAAPLGQIDRFAAEFFGFSPKEAQITDPQHRIFLECAWEALEDAGYVPSRYDGRIGVYAGTGLNTYLLKCLLPYSAQLAEGMAVLSLVIGNKTDFMTSQVSYKLNLRGPSISVNTACSTSLVATHMACQSLLNYECDMALAGGVSVHVPQFSGYVYQPGGVFSRDGRCRPFDAAAQGTVPGNGAGIAVLKRLDDAIADGDHVYAVIRGTCVNNDGAQKVGFTAPSAEGQRDAIATALAMAGVSPSSIGYVEAHGTATALGDPLELKALAQAFSGGDEPATHCAIGSVKSNIGHLDAASGVAGLIKTALCLKHRELVPSLNYTAPNPQIKIQQTPFHVNSELRAWVPNPGASSLRAGVSSFGIGGTNAHVVLESWQALATAPSPRPWQLLPISARSGRELEAAAGRLAAHLEANAQGPLADVAFTLQAGRTPFAQRRAVLAGSAQVAASHLRSSESDFSVAGVANDPALHVAFLFPGMGEQYIGMARGLYDTEAAFREALDECADLLHASHGLDLRAGLFPAGAADRPRHGDAPGGRIDLRAMLGRAAAASDADAQAINTTAFAHPALFAVAHSLARLWMSWGIKPTAMIGHSLGEYVAACIAGVMSLPDALRIVAERARLIEALPPGAMLAVSAQREDLLPLLRDGVCIAASNAPGLSVLSGPTDAIARLQGEFGTRGWAHRLVNSAHAFHSGMIQAVCAPLADLMRGIRLQRPQIPYLSNLTGDWITDAQATNPDYWARHSVSEVRFGQGMSLLLQDQARAFVEVGAGQSLTSFGFQCAEPARRERLQSHPSLPGALEQADDAFVLTRTLGALWCAGIEVDWRAYHAGTARRRVSLPTYPFERQRYWFDVPVGALPPHASAALQEPAPPAAAAASEPAFEISDTRAGYVAPEGDVESAVAELWGAVLGLKTVGRNDHFFRLGGSSLLAVQLMARVRAAFELDVAVRALFDQPTLAAFAAHIEDLLLTEIESLGDRVSAPIPAEEDAQATPYRLPNGMEVMQFNAVETEHFYHDIFETEVYARNGVKIPEQAVIFDVGANIGLFSLFAHARAPGAQIYAFEPAPPVFDALRRNTERAGVNVRLFNAGLTDRPGRQALTFYPNSTGMSSFHADKGEEKAALRAIIENQLEPTSDGAGELLDQMDDILEYRFREQVVECEMRTMSDVIRECGVTHVDLLKIDVQKCEHEVIRGIDDEHWPHIRQIVIEVHDLDGRVAEVSSLLESRGFRVAVEQDALYRGSTISNLYAIRH
ncbi:type I polyketide synthase [Cognatiluteimonas telluris]|uniref:type I polyketide synthase n=1 Tax=Cognatiluteimonas telluris TaxID=1104775 RepID=UPI00140C725A|nr:type I polyketide synthase [Lysobacter telluris]